WTPVAPDGVRTRRMNAICPTYPGALVRETNPTPTHRPRSHGYDLKNPAQVSKLRPDGAVQLRLGVA
ncbi:MAG: hypothetical protein ACTMIR_04915, partial [Cellulomonadaceae bacterium]